MKVVSYSKLPRQVMESPSLEIFKAQQDKFELSAFSGRLDKRCPKASCLKHLTPQITLLSRATSFCGRSNTAAEQLPTKSWVFLQRKEFLIFLSEVHTEILEIPNLMQT